MISKRQEEKNEKIIRGLMKLPPNRRCFNCNSLGPQYVCTNFWTFVCPICSGIHREFTHRVKSVSMAKFTSQEVDALQKGGNQRARELFLVTWDPKKQIHPDNSNVDKVREFIKNVYVEKLYTIEKASIRPPRDSQNHGGETRRASSYHSYSQSPPYDFQYEERRYGKNLPPLTRKPGSDRGLYEGKIFSFLSPSRLKGANEGSYPRASDYSVSSGGDQFRSASPSSQRGIGSPFSDTSSYFSSEVSGHHKVKNGERIWHPQRSESSGSSRSFDSMSFKSVNSVGLQEVASKPEQSPDTFHNKTLSFPSQPQSTIPTTFNGLDLFSEPFAPQNVTSTPITHNSHPLESPLAHSVDLFQQSPIPSLATVSEQTSNGGWATFDAPQNLVPVCTENSKPAIVLLSSDRNNLKTHNPFSVDPICSNQNSAYHEPSASMQALWHDGLQNVETTTNNVRLWNAFEDYPGQQSAEDVPKNSDRAAAFIASDANKSCGFGVYKALGNEGKVRTPGEIEPPSSSFSHSIVAHDFSMIPVVVGVHSLAIEHKSTNPFDLPCDAVLESGNMTPSWDMSSLQAALPKENRPAPYVSDANESWFQNSVASYAPGVATFDPPTGSFGYIVGQASITQISTLSQGPVASVGGNPFA